MVLLFFYIPNQKNFLIHKCENNEAEKYGDFLNYPDSHMEIWDKYYYKKYKVDFDYYPRGRVVYNLSEDTYYIYHDICIKDLNKILDYHNNAHHLTIYILLFFF